MPGLNAILTAVGSLVPPDGMAAARRTPPPPPADADVRSVPDPTPALSALVRASNALPLRAGAASFDASNIAASYPSFQARVAAAQARMRALTLRLVNKIEPAVAAEAASELESTGVEAGASAGEADLTTLLDFLDRLRETSESFVDEAKGQHSSQQVAQMRIADAKLMDPRAKQKRTMPATSARVVNKPQLAFTGGVDNSRHQAYVPRISTKHFSSSSGRAVTYTAQAGVHPFAQELAAPFAHAHLLRTLTAGGSAPQPFVPLDAVPFEFIDTREALASLVAYVAGDACPASDPDAAWRWPALADGARPVREIAVDLEANNFRSFEGITCLMQLSTRGRDVIIDTLALREHMGLLNRVFTDPAIVKVLHGCDSDVVWLQRDFSLFLVNVFDTGQASRALNFPSHGLAHLLLKYATVSASKEYQMADWRERPLPATMVKYAREDTHYLLGIYDRLCGELSAASGGATAPLRIVPDSAPRAVASAPLQDAPSVLVQVLDASTERARQLYAKEAFTLEAAFRLAGRLQLAPAALWMNEEEAAEGGADAPPYRARTPDVARACALPIMRVFLALYAWRDATAREEDESTGFILPNKLLARICSAQPTSVEALAAACHPLTTELRARAAQVAGVVARALADTTGAATLHEYGVAAAEGAAVGAAVAPMSNSADNRAGTRARTELAKLSAAAAASAAASASHPISSMSLLGSGAPAGSSSNSGSNSVATPHALNGSSLLAGGARGGAHAGGSVLEPPRLPLAPQHAPARADTPVRTPPPPATHGAAPGSHACIVAGYTDALDVPVHAAARAVDEADASSMSALSHSLAASSWYHLVGLHHLMARAQDEAAAAAEAAATAAASAAAATAAAAAAVGDSKPREVTSLAQRYARGGAGAPSSAPSVSQQLSTVFEPDAEPALGSLTTGFDYKAAASGIASLHGIRDDMRAAASKVSLSRAKAPVNPYLKKASAAAARGNKKSSR